MSHDEILNWIIDEIGKDTISLKEYIDSLKDLGLSIIHKSDNLDLEGFELYYLGDHQDLLGILGNTMTQASLSPDKSKTLNGLYLRSESDDGPEVYIDRILSKSRDGNGVLVLTKNIPGFWRTCKSEILKVLGGKKI